MLLNRNDTRLQMVGIGGEVDRRVDSLVPRQINGPCRVSCSLTINNPRERFRRFGRISNKFEPVQTHKRGVTCGTFLRP